MTKDELQAFASRCRTGLELVPLAERNIGFKAFPTGACGDSSELLGILLIERAGLSVKYVLGTNHPELGPQATHAWLETDGLIVDITHDQVEGTGLTGWVFERSPWHAKFKRNVQEVTLDPRQWFQFPSNEYQAMKAALDAPPALP